MLQSYKINNNGPVQGSVGGCHITSIKLDIRPLKYDIVVLKHDTPWF